MIAHLLGDYWNPVLAAAFGVLGVALGRYIAQGIHKDGEEKLTGRVNFALTALFGLAAVGYVMDTPTISPLRMLGYGSAAGFIGLSILEFLAATFEDRFRGAIDGFLNPRRNDDHIGIAKAMQDLDGTQLGDTRDGPSE